MQLPLAYYVHHADPFLIQFSEHFGIRYYGLAYLLGFVAAGFLFRRYFAAGRTKLDPEASMDMMLAIVVGVILGGRLGYFVLYHPAILVTDPLALFKVWEGGMASHGGFLGVIVAIWIFARRRQLSFLHLGDLVVTTAPVGMLLGRLANFVNGELWGKISYVSWAVIFPTSVQPGTPIELIPPRHPSQLYLAALEGFVLLAFVQWRFWKTNAARDQPGRIGGEFLVGYSLVRAVGEAFREPDFGVSLLLGLSRGTFYSLFLAAAGMTLIMLVPKNEAKR